MDIRHCCRHDRDGDSPLGHLPGGGLLCTVNCEQYVRPDRRIVEKRTYIRNRRLERGQLIMKMGNRKPIMKSGKRVTDYDK